MAVASEVHHRNDIRLLRFAAPEPKREIGLVWRKTSPRKADFTAFATPAQGAGAAHGEALIGRPRPDASFVPPALLRVPAQPLAFPLGKRIDMTKSEFQSSQGQLGRGQPRPEVARIREDHDR